jgi:UDP-N-acetylmuramyl tripeptide synthase
MSDRRAGVDAQTVGLAATVVGKLVLALLRLLGRRGNALPGLVVEKLFPRYLPRAMSRLPEGVVVVTGTNGKTTTTKMVATVLAERFRVLTNDTGSNFVRGAITATVAAASWRGRLPYDVAVFELDEAWAVRFVSQVAPRSCLLLNVMRDQLDRFGEIDTTARLLGEVAHATTGQVVLNRDDPRIAALATRTRARVSYYGVAPELREFFPNDEELYGGPLHLSDLPAVVDLRALPGPGRPAATLRFGSDGDRSVQLRAEGPHNAQNACGAAALGLALGLDPDTVLAGLAKVSPAFGRGQAFDVDGRRVVLQLVKNPAGFRQVLRGIETERPDAVVVAINDDYADGRDVSWLWDVSFGPLRHTVARRSTSGTRAADMALRLRYDDIAVDEIEPDLEKAVRSAVDTVPAGGRVTVFSTYTAMWALYAVLCRIGTEQR